MGRGISVTDNYTAAGYSASDIDAGTRPAVLVVDLQRGFTDPLFPMGTLPMIHSATERTAELLHVARAARIPVATCYTAYGSEADMPRWKVKAVREEFFHGHPCTEMDPRIHDAAYDFNFCKSGPSIFFLTPLVTFLIKQQVDTVIVTGCTTSGCVRASIIDAFSYGFRVLVPADCCGDADESGHAANLADVARRYAQISSGAAMADYLRGVARLT